MNRRSPASSRLSETARCLSRHLRMKVLAADFDLLPRRRIDHVAVIGSDLLVQALGRMRQSETIVEHLAGIDDCELAMAAYQFAVQRWPKAAITLRQGARVIKDSRKRRMPSQ